jgi:hypothetical protein
MDSEGSAAEGKDTAGTEPAAKVAITPRKASMPTGTEESLDYGLQLTPIEPAWTRRNRICPKAPKVPFETPPSKGHEAQESSQSAAYVPRHHGRRGLISFFRSRRKGSSRVVNFIVLPIAVLIASAVIILLLIFR